MAQAAASAAETPKGARNDWLVPIAMVALVFVMLVPVPSFVLDMLLATSMTLAVIVLLSALSILRPVQFSVFPSLLLFLTLFRISLNIASSRRILLHGNQGPGAAGHVIEAFGQFVVGGNYIVGFVIFLALIAIQYLVINHGAVRTAEVTARFTLDALPGKQMAIDADLNAGLIDETQARARREQITHEAEFYGAMDGAARFSQRDALSTILLTAINIVAGLLIGVFQHHVPIQQALRTYTILTVGDGLVTMIPSLLVSIAGGIVVTLASSGEGLDRAIGNQLFARKRPLQIAAGAMFALGLVPGLPKVSFFLLSGLAGYLSTRSKETPEGEAAVSAAGAAGTKKAPTQQEQMESLLKLDELGLEVGYALVPLVDQSRGGQLLGRIRALRQHLATQLGFLIPSIHITDQAKLRPREYVIQLRGVEAARWELMQDMLLAISSDAAAAPLAGIDTREPAFGAAAKWIAPQLQEQALAAGYAVVDHTSIIATHISEVVRSHAHELLTRQETKRLLDAQATSQPKLAEELVPKLMSLGEVQKVLQQLLREQVSIRDLPRILETLVDNAPMTKNTVHLVEACRQALGRSLVQGLVSEDGKLRVLALDPAFEDEVARAFDPAAAGRAGAVQPRLVERILAGLKKMVGDRATMEGTILLCSSPARFHLRRLLEPFMPRVTVLSPGEIPASVTVQSLGVVE
jgi:flagellar biosynthesis protein FlhA